nr:hypothetical protein [Natronomonas sp. CBA1123]
MARPRSRNTGSNIGASRSADSTATGTVAATRTRPAAVPASAPGETPQNAARPPNPASDPATNSGEGRELEERQRRRRRPPHLHDDGDGGAADGSEAGDDGEDARENRRDAAFGQRRRSDSASETQTGEKAQRRGRGGAGYRRKAERDDGRDGRGDDRRTPRRPPVRLREPPVVDAHVDPSSAADSGRSVSQSTTVASDSLSRSMRRRRSMLAALPPGVPPPVTSGLTTTTSWPGATSSVASPTGSSSSSGVVEHHVGGPGEAFTERERVLPSSAVGGRRRRLPFGLSGGDDRIEDRPHPRSRGRVVTHRHPRPPRAVARQRRVDVAFVDAEGGETDVVAGGDEAAEGTVGGVRRQFGAGGVAVVAGLPRRHPPVGDDDRLRRPRLTEVDRRQFAGFRQSAPVDAADVVAGSVLPNRVELQSRPAAVRRLGSDPSERPVRLGHVADAASTPQNRRAVDGRFAGGRPGGRERPEPNQRRVELVVPLRGDDFVGDLPGLPGTQRQGAARRPLDDGDVVRQSVDDAYVRLRSVAFVSDRKRHRRRLAGSRNLGVERPLDGQRRRRRRPGQRVGHEIDDGDGRGDEQHGFPEYRADGEKRHRREDGGVESRTRSNPHQFHPSSSRFSMADSDRSIRSTLVRDGRSHARSRSRNGSADSRSATYAAAIASSVHSSSRTVSSAAASSHPST